MDGCSANSALPGGVETAPFVSVRDILASMNRGATFAVFCSLATLPLLAQTPLACSAQLVPLRPVGLYCENAAPTCVIDGPARGHWAWGCPASGDVSAVPPGGGVAILPRIQSPHINTPTEVMMKAEQLRNLQLQNQQLQNQINSPHVSPAPPPSVASAPAPVVDLSEIMTMDHPNGNLWKSWNDTGKLSYLLGLREGLGTLLDKVPKTESPTYFSPAMTFSQTETAVDRFYEDPLNVRIPIFVALKLVTMKANGAPQDQIYSELTLDRQISSKK
jgi:hypothetical protein